MSIISITYNTDTKLCRKGHNFNGSRCKICRKIWVDSNRDSIRAYNSKWRQDNTYAKRIHDRSYRTKHKEELNKKHKEKLDNNELFKLACNFRSRISSLMKKSGIHKRNKTESILGCSFFEVKQYLEHTWLIRYKSVYNKEPVHIDHIIPLSSAKTAEDMIKLCHYTNLQYLKPLDNLSKGDKFEEDQ